VRTRPRGWLPALGLCAALVGTPALGQTAGSPAAPAPGTPDLELQQAIRDVNDGLFDKAYPVFEKRAAQGDKRAAITMGLAYNLGRGVAQDYGKAYDWYLSVFPHDGDAFNNIGVMWRDGRGVPADRVIPYLLFLTVHMEGLGDESTQIRANRNLRGEIARLSLAEKHAALCLTPAYVLAFVNGKGQPSSQPESFFTGKGSGQRFRDLGWWAPGEVERTQPCQTP
jgi:hypothetical protein